MSDEKDQKLVVAVKTTKESSSVDCERIVKQVEYYFGDINLPRDKFLQEEMKKEDGWVPLSTMIKFNRLASITVDIDCIAEALKNSHIIDLSDDNTKIRRSPDVPLPENTLEYWQEIKRRTAYLKGFPRETTLDEISEFVGKYGELKNILMRKTKGSKETPKIFKGSAFVTFANVEQAKKLASAKDLKFKDEHELTNMMQDEYWNQKHFQRQEQKELKKQKKKQQIEEQNKAHFTKGLVLKLSGLPTEDKEVDHQTIKDFFEPYGRPAFVVVNGAEATIRFDSEEENAAQTAWEKTVEAAKDGKVLLKGSEISAKVLEGDEEVKYWTEFSKAKISKKQRMQATNKGKYPDRGKKRKAGKAVDGPKGKRIVFEDEEKDEENGEKMESNENVVKKEGTDNEVSNENGTKKEEVAADNGTE